MGSMNEYKIEKKKTYPMEIHNNPTLLIPPQQPLPNRTFQLLSNLPSCRNKLLLIFQIDI